MRPHTKSLGTRVCIAVAGLLGVGLAQDDSGQTAGSTGPTVELEGAEQVKLTPEQMQAKATEILKKLAAANNQVEQMLAQARQDKDIVKVVCVGDKAGQVQTALDTATDRDEAMREAFARGSIERGRHEYTLIVVLGDRVLVLVSEANQCIGEETGFAGESELELEIDPNLPETDPNLVPYLPVLSVEPTVQSPID